MENLIQTFFSLQEKMNIQTDSIPSTIFHPKLSLPPTSNVEVTSPPTTFQQQENKPSSPLNNEANSQLPLSPTKNSQTNLNSQNADLEIDPKWIRHFKELKNFQSVSGHTNVTRTKRETRKLGNWVAEQRRKRKQNRMTGTQVELLSSLGFEWVKKRGTRKKQSDPLNQLSTPPMNCSPVSESSSPMSSPPSSPAML